MQSSPARTPMMTHHISLKATVDEIDPPIWRTLLVPEDMSLAALHQALQVAIGWDDTHMWEFRRDGQRWGLPYTGGWPEPPQEARTTTVGELLEAPGDTLRYVYDFGDEWEVTLQLEDRRQANAGQESGLPVLTGGERAAPPEDCGGPHAYMDLYEAWRGDTLDPNQRAWLGEWDPEAFDPQTVNLPSVAYLEMLARTQASHGGLRPARTEVEDRPGSDALKTFPESMGLRDCLARLPVDQLDTIFANLGFDERPSRRGQREQEIAERLESHGTVEGLLDQHFGEDAFAILEYLVARQVETHVDFLVRERLVGRSPNWLAFEADTPLAELRRWGLVHMGLHSFDGDEAVFVGVPSPLVEAVASWLETNWYGGDTVVEDVVEELLVNPPGNPRVIERTIEGLPTEAVRQKLVERIAEGRIEADDDPTLGLIFETIGLGEMEGRLREIITDPTPDHSGARQRARQAAFSVLSLFSPDAPEQLADDLGIELEALRSMAEQSSQVLFRMAEDIPDVARQFGDHVLEAAPAERDAVFADIDRLRRESGAEAGLVYRSLLAEPSYRPLWPSMLEAIADEAKAGDANFLEKRARELDDDEEARRFRRVAMKLRSGHLEPLADFEGRALMGTCDGQGAFPLTIAQRTAPGTVDLYHLVIRAGDLQVRDGGLWGDLSDAEAEDFIDYVEESGISRFVELPADVALALGHRAIEATDPEELSGELAHTVQRFDRLPRPDAELPALEANADIDERQLVALLNSPPFEMWVFDLSELYDAELLPLPEAAGADSEWRAEAADRLADIPHVAERLGAMAEHTARWFHFLERPEMARLMAAAAESARADFADSPLVDEMLRRTCSFYERRPALGENAPLDQMGDPNIHFELEQRLRPEDLQCSDAEIDRRLALMELAFQVFEFVRPYIPGPRQPRFERMLDLAREFGSYIADHTYDDGPVDRERLARLTDEFLERIDWLGDRREMLRDVLVSNFAELLD